MEQNSIEFLKISPFNSYWAEHNDYQLLTLGRIWIIYLFSVCVFLCVSVYFSPSLSVRVERGCAVGVLLQCRQKPDSPIRYYSLCLFARVCQQYWRLERQSSSTHTHRHTQRTHRPHPSQQENIPAVPRLYLNTPSSSSSFMTQCLLPPSVSTTSLSILVPLFLMLSLFLQFFLFLSLSILSSTLFPSLFLS